MLVMEADVATAALTADEYALFEKIGRPRLVSAGETLFRRGDLGTTMYVLVQGEIDLDFGDDIDADIARIQRWYAPWRGRRRDVAQPPMEATD